MVELQEILICIPKRRKLPACLKPCLGFYIIRFIFYEKNRGDECSRNQTRFSDIGELEHSAAAAFPHDDAVDLSPSIPFALLLYIYIYVYANIVVYR